MRFEIFDTPVVFLIVMTLLVLGVAHLAHTGANAMGWKGLAGYFSLP